MTSLATYEAPAGAVEHRPAMNPADSWVQVLRPLLELADTVKDTDFVPKGLRGNGPAVAAAMLYGRELGMGPLRSLRSVVMIEGTPTLKAEHMRAMVLAAGHSIEWRENTRARCILAGRRRGEKSPTVVEWTLQDARDMGLARRPNWARMPRQMLAARATGELCRMIFADVIGGAYTEEEVTDGAPDVEPAADVAVPAQATRRTAQRRTAVKRKPAAELPAGDDERPAGESQPPLPGEDEPPADGERPAVDEPAADEPADDVHDAEVVDEQPRNPNAPVTEAQLKRLHTFFTTHKITDKPRKLHIARLITGRHDLDSSTHLTIREASQLIDTLAQLADQAGDDFPAALDALMSELDAHDTDDTEDGDQ
ncbi:recombinase RecT [Amycolatopsis sp. CA-128772]|uniref:recombinase RecT n=1 Tax=Amycolatopsis sp. CA-128772 TaxID=2073159 RepID=UPI000CD320F4|nr:recombinase RecT [Amycolatopsis sp. CA-128772]